MSVCLPLPTGVGPVSWASLCTVETCFSLVSLSILKTVYIDNKNFHCEICLYMDQHTDGPVTGALDQGVVTPIYYAVVIALPVIIKIPYTKEGMESLHILPYIIGSRAKSARG